MRLQEIACRSLSFFLSFFIGGTINGIYVRKRNEGSTSKAMCSSTRHDGMHTDRGKNSLRTYINVPLFGNSTGAAISGTSLRMIICIELDLSDIFAS